MERDLGSKFEPFRSLDPKFDKVVTWGNPIDCLRSDPQVPADLAEKLRKNQPIGRHHASIVAKVVERAFFKIETPPSIILNVEFKWKSRHNRTLELGGTPVPFFPTQDHGCWYLCMDYDSKVYERRCKLAVVYLTHNGDRRSVVVPNHVCKRLTQRAAVRGSHVAFIAKSILRAGNQLVVSRSSGKPALKVFGDNEVVLGYCPIEPVNCRLHPVEQGNPCGDEVLDLQPRWRLKTLTESTPGWAR